jgi:hypothetical protein
MAHIAWGKGGEADLAALDQDRIQVRSSIPSAPGSRIAGRLASGAEVRMKVHHCKRTAQGFDIEGRLLDVTREVRAELARLLAPPPSG